MARHGDYVKPRGGVYYVRLQYPAPVRTSIIGLTGHDPGPEFVLSLRTKDRAIAEDRAAPHIRRHKRYMLIHAANSDQTTKWGDIRPIYEQEPGTSIDLPDGGFAVADATTITTRHPDGTVERRPNAKLVAIDFTDEAKQTIAYREWATGRDAIRKRLHKDVDLEIVENYIRRNRKSDEDAASVRNTLAQFKTYVGGKTLAQSKRVDAEGFVAWLKTKGGKRGTGIASKTITRQIALLKAAINVEIKQTDEPRITRNIFELVEIEGGDENHREAFDEDDMGVARAHFHEFVRDEKIMWVWHACSSVRPIEIHGIDFDDVEEAKDPKDIDPATGKPRVYRTRYVGIEKGGKDYSQRALPIPQAVLDLRDDDGTPLLPAKIEGPLFVRSVERICDSINSKLENWGIKTEANGKSFYSCRHRVPRRFIEEGINDEQMTRAIMGHNRKIEPHDAYGRKRGHGHRFPMWRLKIEIDKIGY